MPRSAASTTTSESACKHSLPDGTYRKSRAVPPHSPALPILSEHQNLICWDRASAIFRGTLKANLGFPEQARDRYPAVIVVHTIAGYRDANEGYVAAELRKAGFVTLTYDSFAARRTTGTALQGSPSYLPIGVADAYAALRLLSGEGRIDAGHIAIVGFSYGAEVAHLTALETLRSALNPGPGRFAAHVAFYPGGNFGAVAEPGAYTDSPVLMLLGVPHSACRRRA